MDVTPSGWGEVQSTNTVLIIIFPFNPSQYLPIRCTLRGNGANNMGTLLPPNTSHILQSGISLVQRAISVTNILLSKRCFRFFSINIEPSLLLIVFCPTVTGANNETKKLVSNLALLSEQLTELNCSHKFLEWLYIFRPKKNQKSGSITIACSYFS